MMMFQMTIHWPMWWISIQSQDINIEHPEILVNLTQNILIVMADTIERKISTATTVHKVHKMKLLEELRDKLRWSKLSSTSLRLVRRSLKGQQIILAI